MTPSITRRAVRQSAGALLALPSFGGSAAAAAGAAFTEDVLRSSVQV